MAVVLGPFDALQQLEAQAQGRLAEVFVEVRLGEQEQRFPINTFCSEVPDKRLRRAEPREEGSDLRRSRPASGSPAGRIVERATPTPRRRRRRRDATRRARVTSVSSALSPALQCLSCYCCPARQAAVVRRGQPQRTPSTPVANAPRART